ncbi:MAG: ABC transporter permease [Acidobacteria bacterium]|nr:ABC transporter permease [Acidobacteriota bacterium]MBI3426348.1 ABC transporter permease [Acidobacteriota bacterium]
MPDQKTPEQELPEWKPEIRRRLARLTLEPTRESSIVEELAQHLDEIYAELLASGATPAEAARLTRVQLRGSATLARELRRAARQVNPEPIVLGTNRRRNMIADLWQDLRYAARTLGKNPGFTLVVVVTLALGIGLNTAVYSVVDAVLFRPLPFAEPDRLVEIQQLEAKSGFSYPGLRWEAFQEWRSQTNLFVQVEAHEPRTYTLTGGKEPESVNAPAVTSGLFAMLGVQPKLGRPFNAQDAEPGNDRVVLVGDGFWKSHLGGTPDALGKTLTLNDQRYTVVGVMPPKFKFPYGKFELWVPLPLTAADEQKRPRRFNTVARLRGDTALPTVQAALTALGTRLDTERPDPSGWQTRLSQLGSIRVNPGPRRALLVLLGAVGFVLLLACANAANLLLARAAQRQGEIAIRLALGAGRGRLMRQLLTESLLLALLAGTLGVALARWGVAALAKLVPDELTFLSVNEISLERRVLLFTLALTVLTGFVCGLLPAFKASRPDLHNALKGVTGRATADRAQNRLRHALVVLEVALSLVLLIGAGLMMRSFLHLSGVPPGYEPKNLIAATLSVPSQRYSTLEQEEDFFSRLKSNLAAVPGVESATAAMGVPPQGGGISFNLEIEIEGHPPEPADAKMVLPFSFIDPAYFQTLRIPLLQGRAFGAEDGVKAPPAMIINEKMARRYWGIANPVGQRIRFGKARPWLTIVGVAGDVNLGKPGDGFSEMEVYYPWSQRTRPSSQRTLIMRTTTEASALLASVKSAIWALDKDQPIYRLNLVEDLVSDALAEPRFYLLLLGCFAGFTLLLVALGIYGVMAYTVTQRTNEIGLRMALGASQAQVLTLLLKQGFRLALLGIVIGIGAALAMARLMAAFLFGVPATDPATFAVIAVLLLAIALLACYLPARRAAKVDPLIALRCE